MVLKTKNLNVAVIGVGHLGKHHARIFNELENANLVCVVDTDEERAKEIASLYGCNYYKNYKDIPEDINCVSIAVPTVKHYEIACHFIEKGVNIFVEKPISETVEQAIDIVSRLEKKNLVFQVGHIERYNPVFLSVKHKINDPRFIEVYRLAPYKARSIDIGVVLDLMIHDIDIILTIVESKIKEVKAVGVPVISDNEDIANARLEFESGCVANISVSRISMKELRKIRIFQKKMYLSLDYKERKGMVYELKDKNIVPYEVPVNNEEPLKLELKDFCDCCVASKKPVVSAEHGKNALLVAAEIVKQMKANSNFYNI